MLTVLLLSACKISIRYLNNSERPVDALAVKKVTHSLTDNLKSRDASASKKEMAYPNSWYELQMK